MFGLSGDDRFRLTVELRHILAGYGGPGAPRGYLGKTLLSFAGQYARLDNIDENGCCIRECVFEVRGKTFVRKAKTSARGLLCAFVNIRKEKPHLLDDRTVLQQPAGFLNSVLYKWCIADLAAQFPQSLWQGGASRTGFT